MEEEMKERGSKKDHRVHEEKKDIIKVIRQ